MTRLRHLPLVAGVAMLTLALAGRPAVSQPETTRSPTGQLQAAPCEAPARSGSGVADEDKTASLLVSNFERMAIRFHAYPELSNEYRLNADNTVSIPVIGRINVEGQTADCLERMLAVRASAIARRDVFVNVEAVAYLPIFVAGLVARPGAVQWSPGMTVLQAVTMAGGRFRSAETQVSMDPVRANKSFDEQKRALVALSRLRSERADRGQIEPDPELVRLVGAAEARALAASQESLFVSRRAARENALATVERGMAIAREEIAALRQRRTSVEDQLRLRRASQARLVDLRNKGIVIAGRVLEEDFKLAELDEKAIEISVALARAAAALSGLERDMVALKAGRTAEIDAEIAVHERIAAQARIEVRAAQAAGDLPPARGAPARAGAEVVSIVRRSAAGPQRLNGDDATPVLVGDTIILSLELQ